MLSPRCTAAGVNRLDRFRGADEVRSMWSGSPEQCTDRVNQPARRAVFPLICGTAAARRYQAKVTCRTSTRDALRQRAIRSVRRPSPGSIIAARRAVLPEDSRRGWFTAFRPDTRMSAHDVERMRLARSRQRDQAAQQCRSRAEHCRSGRHQALTRRAEHGEACGAETWRRRKFPIHIEPGRNVTRQRVMQRRRLHRLPHLYRVMPPTMRSERSCALLISCTFRAQVHEKSRERIKGSRSHSRRMSIKSGLVRDRQSG